MGALKLETSSKETGKAAVRHQVQASLQTPESMWPWLKEEAGIVWRFGMWLPLLFLLGVIGAAQGWW